MRWSLRAAVSALLAGAGVLWVAAAAQRWWPACKPGDFDADACIKVQDHLYDYLAPVDPWTPVGNAAQVAGVALALLAVGVALLPWLWVPRRPAVCLAVTVPALAVLLVGVRTWGAGLSGEAMALSGVRPAFLVWIVGLPIAMSVAAATAGDDHTPPWLTRWRVLVAFLIIMSTPLAEALLTPILIRYMSHDSTPWTEAVTGVFLVAAAAAVWPATRPLPRTSPAEPVEVGA